jgi:MFS family permease
MRLAPNAQLWVQRMVLERLRSQASQSFRWKVVWAAFTVAIFSWGVGFYGPSVFLQTLHDDRGWSISTISTAISMHFLLSAGLVIYLPEAQRRFGVELVTQVGIGLAAVGVVGWATAQQPWQLFLVALVSGAGWAATSGAAINSMVASWFERDRPKALSLAFNGASIGGLVFTPLWVLLIARFGFPVTAAIIGTVMVAVLWPIAARYLRPRLNDSHQKITAINSHKSGEQIAPTISRTELLRDPRFVTISLAFALGLFAQIGILAHAVTRLAPEFGANGAAWAVSLMTACAVIGRTMLGWMLGEYSRRVAASTNFLVQVCGSGLLISGSNTPALILGCVLFGLGVGNLTSLPPLIVQKEFSDSETGRAIALITAVNQTVFAFGPAVLGVLRELEGGYTLPFAVAALVQFAAALVIVCYRPN